MFDGLDRPSRVLSQLVEQMMMGQVETTDSPPRRLSYDDKWHSDIFKLTRELSDPIIRSDSAKIIVREYMPACPRDDLEERIFSSICPYLDTTIASIIDGIEKKLEDPKFIQDLEETTLDDQFLELRNLLARWYEIIDWLVKTDPPLPAAHVKSLLIYLPTSVIKICAHCKSKRKRYPHNNLPMVLQDVFRDTCSIIKRFCTLFNGYLEFDINEPTLLKDSINQLGNMATLSAFSVKSLLNTWSTFKNFTCSDDLMLYKLDEYTDLVRNHVPRIGKDIISLMMNLKAPPVEEYNNRVKRVETLLSVMIVLHTNFCSFKSSKPLDEKFIREMIDFLILFKVHQELVEPSLRGDYSDENIQGNSLIYWPGRFETYYKKTEHFKDELTKRAQELPNEMDKDRKLGFHYYILTRKPLPKVTNFEVTLNNMNYIQEEITDPRVYIPNWGTLANGVVDCSVYDCTLTSLCDYINNDTFLPYEASLLKHLFGGKFWSALLSYDILNNCYKRSKNLAFQHMKIFMPTYYNLQSRRDQSLAVTILGRLIVDIWRLMSAAQRDDLLQYINPMCLRLILRSSSESRDRLLNCYKKITGAESPAHLSFVILDLRHQPSAKNWSRLMDLLTLMGIEKGQSNIVRTEDLLKICTFALKTLDEVEDFQSTMTNNLILALFDCACVEKKATKNCTFNWPLLSTLIKGLIVKTRLSEDILVRLCHFLTYNTECLVDRCSDGQITLLSDLFDYLLENENKIIHQEALEAFEHIVEYANENVARGITRNISRKPKLRECVSAYLSKKCIHKIENDGGKNWKYMNIFARQSENLSIHHECYKNEERQRKIPRQADSLDEQAARVCEELKGLTQVKSSLGADAVCKLERACNYFLQRL